MNPTNDKGPLSVNEGVVGHTPGPWTAALGQFDFGNDGSRRIMVGSPDDYSYRRIGTVDPVAPRKDRGKDKTAYNAPDAERDANARLIAAAPELLSALQDAEVYFDDHADVVDGDYGEPAPNKAMTLLTTIRAALSKVSHDIC